MTFQNLQILYLIEVRKTQKLLQHELSNLQLIKKNSINKLVNKKRDSPQNTT